MRLRPRLRPGRFRRPERQLRDRHNGRRMRKRDAGASARHSLGTRSGLQQPERRVRGGCCDATWKLCFVGQPWSQPLSDKGWQIRRQPGFILRFIVV